MWSNSKGRRPSKVVVSRHLIMDHQRSPGVTKKIASSEMKYFSRARSLGVATIAACIVLPLLLLSIVKSNPSNFVVWNLQLSIRTGAQLERIRAVREDSDDKGTRIRVLPVALKEESVKNQSSNPFSTNADIKTSVNGKGGEDVILEPQMRSSPVLYGQAHSDKDNQTNVNNVTQTSLDTKIESTPHIEEKKLDNKTNADTDGIVLTDFAEETHIEKKSNTTAIGGNITGSSSHSEDNTRENNSTTVDTDTKQIQMLHDSEEKQLPKNPVAKNLVPENKVWCDFTQERFDTCYMNGNVRFLGPSSLILPAPPQSDGASPENTTTWKIKPYARKWEQSVMGYINELTLRFLGKAEEIPRCAVNHTVPAIIFSTGGFLGNFFHDFTDVLVPLFVTSRQYHGEVQFLVTNYNANWIHKYSSILNQLTRYEIINMDQDGRVHCYPQAQVGLMSHKVMGIEPSKTPNGYSMDDFRDMLRTSYSLKRKSVKAGSKRPRRLLILQRKGSRSFVNRKEVVRLGKSLGFKVAVAGPEEMKNLTRFAQMVNSYDVMIGVHGAGLTNMFFLPTGASLIQIVPWGGLRWACFHDFGEPAPDMGMKYLEYEIKEEESTLIQQYPRDHPVFTDPLSIHKQGWGMLWSVFLHKQHVKLDVNRFKPVLLEALQSLH